jgi:hypothetical protein
VDQELTFEHNSLLHVPLDFSLAHALTKTLPRQCFLRLIEKPAATTNKTANNKLCAAWHNHVKKTVAATWSSSCHSEMAQTTQQADNALFTPLQLDAITPAELVRHFCMKVCGTPVPGPDNNPTLGQHASTAMAKKAISC